MSAAKPKLTFKKQPSETGLARVCQGPRGAKLFLHEGGKRIELASVNYSRDPVAWFWSAPASEWTGEWHNTAASGIYYRTIELAKAGCLAWVRAALAATAAAPKEAKP